MLGWEEIFRIEEALLSEWEGALDEDREFTEREKKFYDAHVAALELRKYLQK